VTLDDVWAELPLTYQSMAVPKMPNFLMVNRPYSPGGTDSVVGIVEVQVVPVTLDTKSAITPEAAIDDQLIEISQ
jgi:hypothetical protein